MRTRLIHAPFAARLMGALMAGALCALLMAGCAGAGSTTQQVNLNSGSSGLGGSTVNPAGDGKSGFSGTVTRTPTSTTSSAQPPVAGATIVATLSDGTVIGKAVSDGAGNYRIPLVPGTFLLTAQNISTLVPIAPTQQYTISTDKFTTVNFVYINNSSQSPPAAP